jgi:hypothetical protein
MRVFHLMLLDTASREPRRVDFEAESPDHAFQVARNETDGIHVELWEGGALLARMTKSAANVWKLLPTAASPSPVDLGPVDHIPLAPEGIAWTQGS